jgi:adenosylcobinamide kinase/adenosylcobinamide-phosphate guanylyltransferase
MTERIREHRRARPSTWDTLELPRHIGREIKDKAENAGVVLIDCVTLLIGNIFWDYIGRDEEKLDTGAIEKECQTEIDELTECLRQVSASFIIVTNEVGEGVVPEYQSGRLFRDTLGSVNQRLAKEVDTVYLMVAGIPLRIK